MPTAPPRSRNDPVIQSRPLTISANRARRTGVTAPSSVIIATALSTNDCCSGLIAAGEAGRAPYAAPKAARTFRMRGREEVDGRRVLALDHWYLQLPHEPARCHPEVVPDDDEGLEPIAVALPQGQDQLRLGAFLRACSHCSNWSSTISSFDPEASTVPRRTSASASTNFASGLIRGHARRTRARRRGSRSLVAPSWIAITLRDSRGSSPACTIDDLPQPDGP